jgi:hypothetical protein
MRNFDAQLYAELLKEVLQQFFILEIQLASGTYRYTETDIDIYYGGNKFSPRGFTFDNLNGSSNLSVDNLDIDIDDTDQELSALLLGEDVRNKIAILYYGVIANQEVTGSLWADGVTWEDGVVWMPSYTQKIVIVEEFLRYIIGGWELSEDNLAKITLTNELVLWKKTSLRQQSSSCQWAFKGAECGYTGGETWCDQSYERCLALSNEINFIGFRFLPALMITELWWGRTPNYTG